MEAKRREVADDPLLALRLKRRHPAAAPLPLPGSLAADG
jgi:hypothetical protein